MPILHYWFVPASRGRPRAGTDSRCDGQNTEATLGLPPMAVCANGMYRNDRLSTMNRSAGKRTGALLRLDALAIADGAGLELGPGSLLLEEGRVLAAGTPPEVDHHPAAEHARREAYPDSVLIPGLVNTHCHLDLTHIGPRPHDPERGFVSWVEMIRQGRIHPSDEAAITASVRRGIELSIAGGTAAVGDIAGAAGPVHTLAPWRALRESPLLGVSFVECFGIGRRRRDLEASLVRFVDDHAGEFSAQDPREGARLGLQPHAPNTVSLTHYRAVIAQSRRFGTPLPLATHLAETAEERRFVAEGAGPQREMLEGMGLWDDADLAELRRAPDPVAHLRGVLSEARFLAAHVNDAPDDAIDTLVRTGTSVAYCPRASAYFAAERTLGPHRHRDMLAAGVNVALGTDSIVNLPRECADAARGGISILDEMRFLHRRDGTDPGLLLRMATINGATALGLDTTLFTLGVASSPLAVLAVRCERPAAVGDALASVLRASAAPVVVVSRGQASA